MQTPDQPDEMHKRIHGLGEASGQGRKTQFNREYTHRYIDSQKWRLTCERGKGENRKKCIRGIKILYSNKERRKKL